MKLTTKACVLPRLSSLIAKQTHHHGAEQGQPQNEQGSLGKLDQEHALRGLSGERQQDRDEFGDQDNNKN